MHSAGLVFEQNIDDPAIGSFGGSSIAARHSIDRRGLGRKAVGNSQRMEYLNPQSDGKVTILARFLQSATA
ncbi:hypothetical protein IU471_18750 [Nocardia elegans]|nr:hypothetical protein [Nocardia elegans]